MKKRVFPRIGLSGDTIIDVGLQSEAPSELINS